MVDFPSERNLHLWLGFSYGELLVITRGYIKEVVRMFHFHVYRGYQEDPRTFIRYVHPVKIKVLGRSLKGISQRLLGKVFAEIYPYIHIYPYVIYIYIHIYIYISLLSIYIYMVLLGIDARNRDVVFVYRLDIQVRGTCDPPMSPPAHLGARLSFRFLRQKQRERMGNFRRLVVGVVHACEFRYLSGLIYCLLWMVAKSCTTLGSCKPMKNRINQYKSSFKYISQDYNYLVGGSPTPLKKYAFVSLDHYSQLNGKS